MQDRRVLGLGSLLVASLASCSSSSNPPVAPPETGAANAFKCGTGGITGYVRVTDASSVRAVAGAIATGEGCNTATSDDRGFIEFDLPEGKLVKVDVTATGYLAGHVEVTPVASGAYNSFDIFPIKDKTSIFTGWTADKGYLFVGISNYGADAGSCTSSDGLVVSVKGHPEIAAGYLTDPNTRSATLTTTTAFGSAVLGPIAPGTYEIEATKTGCVAGPDHGRYFTYPQTMDVKADAVSNVLLKLPL